MTDTSHTSSSSSRQDGQDDQTQQAKIQQTSSTAAMTTTSERVQKLVQAELDYTNYQLESWQPSNESEAAQQQPEDAYDDGGLLLGRLIIIHMKFLEEPCTEPGRKAPFTSWEFECTNAARLMDGGVVPASMTSETNQRLQAESEDTLEMLGLGGFQCIFSEDVVHLHGFANHITNASAAGIPPEMRRFLARFRRHVLSLEQFHALDKAIASEEVRMSAEGRATNTTLSYLEIFFPDRRSWPRSPGAPAATGYDPSRLDKEIVVCVNSLEGEPGTVLGQQGERLVAAATVENLKTLSKFSYRGYIKEVNEWYESNWKGRCASINPTGRPVVVFRKI